MSGISTHILDLARGLPAAGVIVQLFREPDSASHAIAEGLTDENGRIHELLSGNRLSAGSYRLRFSTGAYFQAQGVAALHPFVEIVIEVRSSGEHHHIPLLVTPHSYSTYRGS